MGIIQEESKVIETVIPLELVCPLNLSNKNLAATFNSWCTHPFIVRTCLGHPPFWWRQYLAVEGPSNCVAMFILYITKRLRASMCLAILSYFVTRDVAPIRRPLAPPTITQSAVLKTNSLMTNISWGQCKQKYATQIKWTFWYFVIISLQCVSND